MAISEMIQTYGALGSQTSLNFGQYAKRLQNEIAKEKKFREKEDKTIK